jgi:hypothetical protein
MLSFYFYFFFDRFDELLRNADANPDYLPQSSQALSTGAVQVEYSPDGRLIGSFAEHDRLLKVWYTLPYEIGR